VQVGEQLSVQEETRATTSRDKIASASKLPIITDKADQWNKKRSALKRHCGDVHPTCCSSAPPRYKLMHLREYVLGLSLVVRKASRSPTGQYRFWASSKTLLIAEVAKFTPKCLWKWKISHEGMLECLL